MTLKTQRFPFMRKEYRMKDPEKVKEGKRYKRAGMLFEVKVREDLEKKGWIVDRWSNQVELIQYSSDGIKDNPDSRIGKLVKAKSNRFNMRTTGFPDFIIFKLIDEDTKEYKVCGIEVKMKGKLSKEEKEKCVWLLKNKIFIKIFIACKTERGMIRYEEFKSKFSVVKQMCFASFPHGFVNENK